MFQIIYPNLYPLLKIALTESLKKKENYNYRIHFFLQGDGTFEVNAGEVVSFQFCLF